VLLITLFAFGLRLFRLGFYSLRGDEAFDVLFARQSLAEILAQLRHVQIYPPLFHTGLHFWLRVAGSNEIALRFWAAVCATLAVPVVYVLGKQLFNRQVGLGSAVLMAANPFAQWWGQDMHFYAYLLATSGLVYVAALRFWKGGSHSSLPQIARRYAVPYVLLALLGLLTHYFVCFTWGALNLVALAQTVRQRWDRNLLYGWWGAQGMLLLLYLPWLIAAFVLTTTYTEPWIRFAPPGEMLWRTVIAFTTGYATRPGSVFPPIVPLVAGGGGLLFLTGLGLAWRRANLRPSLFLVLTLLLSPLFVIYGASFRRPMYDEKLVIFLLPLFVVVLAVAIVEVSRYRRWAGWLLMLGILLAMGYADYTHLFDTRFAKSPAWREMAAYVRNKAERGDVFIYNNPDPAPFFYIEDTIPAVLLPSSHELSAVQIGDEVEETIAPYRRVWLTPLVEASWDAHGDVQTWLDRHADRIGQIFFRGTHILLYLTPATWQAMMTPQKVQLADGVQLVGFRIASGEGQPAGDERTFHPGETLYLRLYWRSGGPTQTPYTVFSQLLGPDGRLYAQWDNPPVQGSYPTTGWKAGETIVDAYNLLIAPDAPPGSYQLWVGMYNLSTGERLPVLDDTGHPAGDHIVLNATITLKEK
ncbi:MAG: hypothetical protein D6796_10595, partial [Caldilineae bacterium]